MGRELHNKGAEIHYRFVPYLSKAEEFNHERSVNKVEHASVPSVFPRQHSYGVERNPKTVLILDDYQPDKRGVVAKAIEIAAQFGGFVIMTSNYTDPFKILDPSPAAAATPESIITEDMAQRIDPEAMQRITAQRAEQEAELSASLRSRISAGFKFIQFSGPDYRAQKPFWG